MFHRRPAFSKNRIWLMLFFALITSFSTAYSQQTAEASLAVLKSSLDHDQVKTIEVLHLPSSMLYRSVIGPAAFAKMATYHLIVSGGFTRAATSFIKDLAAIDDVHSIDCRWEIKFIDAEGNEIVSILTGSDGSFGYLNGHVVRFNDDVAKRIPLLIGALN